MGSLYCRRPSVDAPTRILPRASGGPRDSQTALTSARLGVVFQDVGDVDDASGAASAGLSLS